MMLDLMQDLQQGTPEWLQARIGKVTASRISDVMAKVKSGEAQSRIDYKYEIVGEILTGRSQENTFCNEFMRWGIEQEPFARAAYEIQMGVMVEPIGLVGHPTISRGAASPDGLVNGCGLLEIKCPKTATHLNYLQDGSIPKKYQLQMLWQMACTGRQWVDFASFDPRVPEDLQLFVNRFSRDQARIDEIEAEVNRFLQEVDEIIERLLKRKHERQSRF